MEKRLVTARARVETARVAKRYDGDLFLDAAPSHRKTVLHIPASAIPCGPGSLEIPELYVGNTEHIGIIGPNGAGKTTFLDHVRRLLTIAMPAGPTAPEVVEVLDIPQEPDRRQKELALAEMRQLSHEELGSVLSCVAQLNSDPRAYPGGRRDQPRRATEAHDRPRPARATLADHYGRADEPSRPALRPSPRARARGVSRGAPRR